MSFGFSDQSFQFLKDLEANNNRDWFNDNKQIFKESIEQPFVALLEALSNRLEGSPRPLIGSKKTMFRIHRDTRFSPDKRPYKTTIGGMLTPSGVKGGSAGMLYLHFAQGGGFLAGGFYGLSPKQLVPMRQAMVDRADDFDAVLTSLRERGRALSDTMTLSAMPKGFAEHAEHRHADKIKYKSLMVTDDLTQSDWTSGDVIDRAQTLANDTAALLLFERPGA